MSHTSSDKQWAGRTDGMPWMHRSLIAILRHVNIRVLYAVVDVVIVFYMLFAHKFYLATYHYFRRRHQQKPLRAFVSVYLTFRCFGQVIIDRFAVYAGHSFSFDILGNEHILSAMQQGNGCLLLSSHVGNYEMAGYFLKPTRKMYALMYGGEKGTIMDNRRRMFAANGITLITPDPDWQYLYTITNALNSGDMLTMLADRNFGAQGTIPCTVANAGASLPKGPFAIAKMFDKATTLAVFVMKTGTTHYTIHIKHLQATTPKAYAEQFAQHLSEIIMRYPTQWFNFFEFWD